MQFRQLGDWVSQRAASAAPYLVEQPVDIILADHGNVVPPRLRDETDLRRLTESASCSVPETQRSRRDEHATSYQHGGIDAG